MWERTGHTADRLDDLWQRASVIWIRMNFFIAAIERLKGTNVRAYWPYCRQTRRSVAESECYMNWWNEETNFAVRYAGMCFDVACTFNFADGFCLLDPWQVAAAHYVLCEAPGFVRFTVPAGESSTGSQQGKWKLKGKGNLEEMSAKPNRK